MLRVEVQESYVSQQTFSQSIRLESSKVAELAELSECRSNLYYTLTTLKGSPEVVFMPSYKGP